MKRTAAVSILMLVAAMLYTSSAPALAADMISLVRVRLGKGLDQRALVERNVDILSFQRDGIAELAVTDDQLSWLKSLGVSIEVIDRSLSLLADLDENLGAYYTYAEMEAALDSLAERFPALTRIDTLGTSIEGRLIRAIKISDNAAIDEAEPEALIIGCLHAREIMSVEIPLRLAAYLLERYAVDPRVAAIVDGREIWIAPMINPDGHVYVEQNHLGDADTWWRKNRRLNFDGSYGVDLNRNFGYLWGYDDLGSSPHPNTLTYRGTAPFSEPETQAVRDLCASREFTVNLSYHSFGEQILYPWGYDAIYTDDQALFGALGDSLSAGNGYIPGNWASGVGYLTNGGSCDWMYGDVTTKGRVFGFTIELNSGLEGYFAPPDSLIVPTFNKMLELNLRIIEYADNPYRVIGPLAGVMNPVIPLSPVSYEISWRPYEGDDPNPALAYDLVELLNMRGGVDSCEAGDTLWTAHGFTLSTARAAAGLASWYSGRGDNLKNTLSMASVYPAGYPTILTCQLWYDIELNWDYAYLEVSADQGVTWSTVPGNRTTTTNPYGANRGNGITGKSGKWVSATFDLSSFLPAGDDFLMVRFKYETDAYNSEEGIYVDLVDPTMRCDERTILASGFADTRYLRYPSASGTYTYQMRGIDAEGHLGPWSNLVSHVFDELAGVPAPPLVSRLAQNYPNPFNPATVLSFTVGAGEVLAGSTVPVRLALYDVSGRLVAVLLDRALAPGAYAASWNGRTAGGGLAAAGVYLARLSVGNETFTRKLVLVR